MGQLDHRPATPADALAELLAGNERFVRGTRTHPHQDAERRAALAAEQRPFAVVFACSDSRLAAEIIFDRGLGDLFVVRTAGHIIGPEVRASIEYAVMVLRTPLVVVLGHDSCGAIRAAHGAFKGTEPVLPDLRAIVDRITPSIQYAQARHITDPDGIAGVHVQRTLDMLNRPGTALADATAAGQCDLVGMSYRLADGRVAPVTPGPRDTAPAPNQRLQAAWTLPPP
jgi:carbonic anhydrase